MTERDLKAMYKNAALPEERMTELEKRFVEMVQSNESNSADDFSANKEAMQYDLEIKPQPKKRSLRSIMGFCAAAAAVVGISVGVTLAYRGGYIGTASNNSQTTEEAEQTEQNENIPRTTMDAETSKPEDSENALLEEITEDMLPEYKNKGILDVLSNVDYDYTTFMEKTQYDIDNNCMADADVIGCFTITDSCEDADANSTVYTFETQAVYYQTFGFDAMNEPLKVTLYGNAYAQYDGCPPYYEGDMIVAALKYDYSVYPERLVLAAEYALADVITINQNSYAAVRNSAIPQLGNENNLIAQGFVPLSYTTTVSRNPARYYAIYELSEFSNNLYLHLKDCMLKSDNFDKQSFNIDGLSFSSDKAAMELFEEYFYGEWAEHNPWTVRDNRVLFSYTYGSAPYFGEIAEDEDAVYMLAETTDNTQKILCIMKNAPETMYVYDNQSGDILREDYTTLYALAQKEEPSYTDAGNITTFGLMNVLTDYPEELCDIVWDTLSSASTEYLGAAWSRSSIFDGENVILNSAKADRLTITIKLTNNAAPKYSRYFRAEFAKENGWAAKLTPASGDEENIAEFFSPLESAENYPTEYAIDGGKISVTYYTAPRTDGKTDIYAFRDLGYAPAEESRNLCEIYCRDPNTDEYAFIAVGYAPSIMASGTDVYLSYTPYYYDNCEEVMLYEDGMAKNSASITTSGERSYGVEFSISGEYLLMRQNLGSEYKWIVTEKSLGSTFAEYADNELAFTDGGFMTTKDGKTIIWDNAGENLEGALLMLTSRLQNIWFGFEISAPAEKEAVEIGERIVYEMQNEEFYTREGILNYFERVLTPQAAESFYNDCLDHSIVEYDGTVYSTGGARGSNLSYGELSWEVTKFDPDNNLYEITYTVYYSEFSESEGEIAETYTLNAVKTDDGWRLDGIYMPY